MRAFSGGRRNSFRGKRRDEHPPGLQSPPSATAGVNAAHFTLPPIVVPLPAVPLIVKVPPAPSPLSAVHRSRGARRSRQSAWRLPSACLSRADRYLNELANSASIAFLPFS
jgi:hypothetical protein